MTSNKLKVTGDKSLSKATLAGALPAFFVPLSILKDTNHTVNDRAQSGKKRGSTFLTLDGGNLCFAVATGSNPTSPWTLVGSGGGGGSSPDLSAYLTETQSDARYIQDNMPDPTKIYARKGDGTWVESSTASTTIDDDLTITSATDPLTPEFGAGKQVVRGYVAEKFMNFPSAIDGISDGDAEGILEKFPSIGGSDEGNLVTYYRKNGEVWVNVGASTGWQGWHKIGNGVAPSAPADAPVVAPTQIPDGTDLQAYFINASSGRYWSTHSVTHSPLWTVSSYRQDVSWNYHVERNNGGHSCTVIATNMLGGMAVGSVKDGVWYQWSPVLGTLGYIYEQVGAIEFAMPAARDRQISFNQTENGIAIAAGKTNGINELYLEGLKNVGLDKFTVGMADGAIPTVNADKKFFGEFNLPTFANLKDGAEEVNKLIEATQAAGITRNEADKLFARQQQVDNLQQSMYDNELALGNKAALDGAHFTDTISAPSVEIADPDINPTNYGMRMSSSGNVVTLQPTLPDGTPTGEPLLFDAGTWRIGTDAIMGADHGSAPASGITESFADSRYIKRDSGSLVVSNDNVVIKKPRSDSFQQENSQRALTNKKYVDENFFKQLSDTLRIGSGANAFTIHAPSKAIVVPDANWTMRNAANDIMAYDHTTNSMNLLNPRAFGSQDRSPNALVQMATLTTFLGSSASYMIINTADVIGGINPDKNVNMVRLVGDRNYTLNLAGAKDKSILVVSNIAREGRYVQLTPVQGFTIEGTATQYVKANQEKWYMYDKATNDFVLVSAANNKIRVGYGSDLSSLTEGKLRTLRVLDDTGSSSYNPSSGALQLDLRSSPSDAPDTPASLVTRLSNIGHMSIYTNDLHPTRTSGDLGNVNSRLKTTCEIVSNPYVVLDEAGKLTLSPLGDISLHSGKSQFAVSATIAPKGVATETVGLSFYLWDDTNSDYLRDENGEYLAVNTTTQKGDAFHAITIAGTVQLTAKTSISLHLTQSSNVMLSLGEDIQSSLMLQAITKMYKTGNAMLQYTQSTNNAATFKCTDYDSVLGSMSGMLAAPPKQYHTGHMTHYGQRFFLETLSDLEVTKPDANSLMLRAPYIVNNEDRSIYLQGVILNEKDTHNLRSQTVTFSVGLHGARATAVGVFKYVGSDYNSGASVIAGDPPRLGDSPRLASGWVSVGDISLPTNPTKTTKSISVDVPLDANALMFAVYPTDYNSGGIVMDSVELTIPDGYTDFVYHLNHRTPNSLMASHSVFRSELDFTSQANGHGAKLIPTSLIPVSAGVEDTAHSNAHSGISIGSNIAGLTGFNGEHASYFTAVRGGTYHTNVWINARAGSRVPDGHTALLYMNWSKVLSDGSLQTIPNQVRSFPVVGGSGVTHLERASFELNLNAGDKVVLMLHSDASSGGGVEVVQPKNSPSVRFELSKVIN